MDKRLQLTDEQKALVEQLQDIIDKLRKSNVTIVSDDDAYAYFFNGENVFDYHWPENTEEGVYRMELEDLPCVQIGAIRTGSDDYFLGIDFK